MADPVLPTHDDLYATFQAEVLDRDPRLTDWNAGSSLDALAGGGAALAGEVCLVGVNLFKAVFVDTAEGEELDALAEDRYGTDIARKAASAAIGTLTVTRSGTAGVLPIPAGSTVSGTVDGQTVTVTTLGFAQIPAGSTSVAVQARCTQTGPAGNVAAGVLTRMVSTLDEAVTVSHAERFTGGAEAESDEAFRDRLRRYHQTLRRGTVEALELGALSVGGVSFVTVSEAFIAPADGGYVAVYVGDPDAYANAALVALVVDELRHWRAAGVWVQVFAASRVTQTLSLVLRVARGADQAALLDAVRAAVQGYTEQLAPGETLYLSQVLAAAVHAHPDVLDCAATTPTDDVTPALPQDALRVPDTALTLTVVED